MSFLAEKGLTVRVLSASYCAWCQRTLAAVKSGQSVHVTQPSGPSDWLARLLDTNMTLDALGRSNFHSAPDTNVREGLGSMLSLNDERARRRLENYTRRERESKDTNTYGDTVVSITCRHAGMRVSSLISSIP